jgi:hypothetical protein
MTSNRLALLTTAFAPLVFAAGSAPASLSDSAGVYRLPYADGTRIKIFDDASTHRPIGRIDMTGAEGKAPYRIVAAADGTVMLEHLHFEVALPDAAHPVDAGGFLTDNDNSKRERNARFCNVKGAVIKDTTYSAESCPKK